MNERYIIVGAGGNGIALLNRLGQDRVSFFADNNKSIIGKRIEGIEVIPVDEITRYVDSNRVIISVENKTQIKAQLEELGVMEYVIYLSDWRKECVSRNILCCELEGEKEINRQLRQYSDLSVDADPIRNTDDFKKLVIRCKNDNSLRGCFNILGRDWESLTYGHFHEMIKYANILNADSRLFPIIPHAPFFFDNLRTFESATMFSSPYLKEENNKAFPYIPSFLIGEYMQYVSSDNSDKNTSSSDSVVVFMHHSVEAIRVIHEYEYLMRSVFAPLLERYNHVYLSTYWYDLDDELYAQLEKDGVKLVSAGFRFDERFISRLRTIIDTCDDIVVYGRTSAVIYALAMGKRLFYHKEYNSTLHINDSNINNRFLGRERSNAITTWESIVLSNYGKRFEEFSEEDKRVINYYLGISVHRSPEEIRIMYDICKDIWENSVYTEKEYPMAVYRTYWKYQTDGDYDKLAILSEALPAGFWNL